jgi:PAS domain S-box-containing protein
LISENAADVIWMWDLEEGRCVYVSPSVEQLRGFSPEEILAQPMDQAMPGDTYRMAAAEIQSRRAAVESGDESARIRRMKWIFPQRRHNRSHGNRYETGSETGERRKAGGWGGARLQQPADGDQRLQPAAARQAEGGRSAAGRPGRDPQGRRARRGLTQQLLAFSRKQILQPRVLDLNRVVEEMRPMLERLMGEDVEVCVKLARGSGDDLRRSASTGAGAHEPGGELPGRHAARRQVSIETGFVEWDESQAQSHPGAHAGPYVMLAVSDTGEGMSEETRGHIFEPFFTTKEVGKGTGLGLSTVHGIVEQSGGYVEVASEPGRGTTFKIYLPRVVDAPADSGSRKPFRRWGARRPCWWWRTRRRSGICGRRAEGLRLPGDPGGTPARRCCSASGRASAST